MLSLKEKIMWFALCSRIFVILSSAVINILIPDHDAGVFLIPLDPSLTFSIGDKFIEHLLGGLVRWDAHYYIHIAMYGYTFENCLAFFPVYPMTVRVAAAALSYPLHSFLNMYSITVLSAVMINIFCFVKSAGILFRLSSVLFKDANFAYTVALIYCLNPASIFFSAPYSEAMFACFSFYGILMCAEGRFLASSVPFGLSAATRSNGILNIGYFLHPQIKVLANLSLPGNLSKEIHKYLATSIKISIKTGISLVTGIFLSIFPFVIFQMYGYHKFCNTPIHNLPAWLVDHAQSKGFVLPGAHFGLKNSTLWCNSHLPLAYSYVQSNYWDVGFLKYYQWKQMPNFLLAAPVVFIVLSQSCKFAKEHWFSCLTLGLFDVSEERKHLEVEKGPKKKIMDRHKLVYVFHAAILVIFCVLCVHVQVTTRMIASSCPVFYWFAASILLENQSGSANIAKQLLRIKLKKGKAQSELDLIETVENQNSRWKVKLFSLPLQTKLGRAVYFYFIAYFFIGIALFSNFFPWT